MKLLIVEDNERAARTLGRALSEHGFTIEIAFDGPGGLEMALGGSFDCLLLDVMLPGMDGFTLLQEVRNMGVDVPVILPNWSLLTFNKIWTNTLTPDGAVNWHESLK